MVKCERRLTGSGFGVLEADATDARFGEVDGAG